MMIRLIAIVAAVTATKYAYYAFQDIKKKQSLDQETDEEISTEEHDK